MRKLLVFATHCPQHMRLLMRLGDGTPGVVITSPCEAAEITHVYKIGIFRTYRKAYPKIMGELKDIQIIDWTKEDQEKWEM